MQIILHIIVYIILIFTIPVSIIAQPTNILTEGNFPVLYSLPIRDTNSIKKTIDYALRIGEKQPDSAIMLLNSSLLTSKKLSDTNRVLTAYNALGILYAYKGKEQEAISYFLLAIEGTEKRGLKHLPELAVIYSNLGNFFLRIEQYDKAFQYLEKSKALAERTGNYQQAGGLLINFGDMYMKQNKPDTAELYFQEALKVSQRYNNKKTKSLALINLANLRLLQKRTKEALNYLAGADSIKGNDKEENLLHRNHAYYLRGVAYFQQKDYKAAERYLTTALNNMKQRGDYLAIVTVHQMLAIIYAADSCFEKAYKHQQTYIALKDSLQREKSLKDINLLEIQYQTEKKDREITEQKLINSQREAKIKQKNLWIWAVSVCSILFATMTILLLTAFRRRKKLQEKEIKLIQQEQKITQLSAVMQSEEKERNRIGRDLHDSIGGMIAAINMNLKTAIKRNKGITDMKDFEEVYTMLQDTAREIRKTAHNLIPDVLKEHNLEEALSLYCNQINRTGEITIELYCYDLPDVLDSNLTINLYRMIQELVQNILKHANATRAAIQIRQLDDLLSINVEDNGTGFNIADDSEGMGLKNISSRIEAMQGYISIDSSSGSGTTVYIELELKKLKQHSIV